MRTQLRKERGTCGTFREVQDTAQCSLLHIQITTGPDPASGLGSVSQSKGKAAIKDSRNSGGVSVEPLFSAGSQVSTNGMLPP